MQRPVSVTVVSWLYIFAGTVGIVYHASDVNAHGLLHGDTALVLLMRLLAIAGGIFSLRRAGWARWLLLAWITYHFILSFFHSPVEIIVHALIFAATAWALYHRQATAWFRHAG